MTPPYRAAVIGCGRIGDAFAESRAAIGIYSHAEAYVQCPQTELVAICDTDPKNLETCGRRWNVAARYRSASELLAEIKPDIVSICTPDTTHFELGMAALEASGTKALLLEKPLATFLEEARTLVARSRTRRIPVAVNYSRRYAASHQSLRTALRGGAIGSIQNVSGYYTKGVIHNGTHWFDLARFLVGEVVRVRGFSRRATDEVDPTLDSRIEFASGATGYLHGCDANAFTIFEMDIVGSTGRFRLIDSGHQFESFAVVESANYPGYRNLTRTSGQEGGLRDVTLHAVEDLISCVALPDREPICSPEDALRSMEIALAVRESAQRQKAISV